jgi:tripartite-type tricarboxylate transporter receptor subunit TctC
MSLLRLGCCAALLFALSQGLPAAAADNGTLTIIDPYGPGSVTDHIIEILKPGLEKATGETVAVAHGSTPGADAALAQLASAAPDGNTVLVIDLLSVELADTAGNASTKLSSLTPIAKLTGPGSASLVVAASSPIKSWADFAAAAKAKPLKIAFPGRTSAAAVPVALMERALGVHFTDVAAVGRDATISAIASGQADAGFLVTNTLFPENSPPTSVRAVVSFGAKRNPALKDVPTFAESIGPQPTDKRHNAITSVVALFGPGKLDAATVKRLNGAFAAAAKSAQQGGNAKPGGVPIEIGDSALLHETMARDARVIKETQSLLQQ